MVSARSSILTIRAPVTVATRSLSRIHSVKIAEDCGLGCSGIAPEPENASGEQQTGARLRLKKACWRLLREPASDIGATQSAEPVAMPNSRCGPKPL
jgi:hypothetical protein